MHNTLSSPFNRLRKDKKNLSVFRMSFAEILRNQFIGKTERLLRLKKSDFILQAELRQELQVLQAEL